MLFMIIYVDDFTFSSPLDKLQIRRDLTAKGISLKKPEALCAAKVLKGLLYGARFDRFDLLRAMNCLTEYITEWTHECEVHYCLMCYVHTSLHFSMCGWVGKKPN